MDDLSTEGERERERWGVAQQLVTDSVGDLSSQFVLLIGELAQFAHFKVCLSNTCNFLAAEDSAGAFLIDTKCLDAVCPTLVRLCAVRLLHS